MSRSKTTSINPHPQRPSSTAPTTSSAPPSTSLSTEPSSSTPITPPSLDDFDRAIAINASGTLLCLREAANRIARGGGKRIGIVSTSLFSSFRPGYGDVEGRGEGGDQNNGDRDEGDRDHSELRVQRIMIEEPPFGRLGQPREITHVARFLCGDMVKWVSGQIIRANGAYILIMFDEITDRLDQIPNLTQTRMVRCLQFGRGSSLTGRCRRGMTIRRRCPGRGIRIGMGSSWAREQGCWCC